MSELNNEFHIPQAEATSFQDGDRLDLHVPTSENIRSLEAIRESVRLANTSYEPQPENIAQPEVFSGLSIIGAAEETRAINNYRRHVQHSQLDIFDQSEAA